MLNWSRGCIYRIALSPGKSEFDGSSFLTKRLALFLIFISTDDLASSAFRGVIYHMPSATKPDALETYILRRGVKMYSTGLAFL